jgi:hypothetical protein
MLLGDETNIFQFILRQVQHRPSFQTCKEVGCKIYALDQERKKPKTSRDGSAMVFKQSPQFFGKE